MSDPILECKHAGQFSQQNPSGEKRTLAVLILTAVTMVAEIVAGSIYGSMALLADGWHMGTHVAAFCITLFAYHYARKHQHNPEFSFGTGKVNVLGGYTSAIALGVVAFVMLIESTQRIFSPHDIAFNQAIFVAIVGLVINLISALLLSDHHHDHHHGHHHSHDHDHHHDHNLKAAYMHVLADALTSVLAIVALFAGKYLGWHVLDPIMGIVGAIIISRWAIGLVKQTSPVLLDMNIDAQKRTHIRDSVEKDGPHRILDLHVWKISGDHYAAMLSIETHLNVNADYFKQLLKDETNLSHTTIEVHHN
ncbi:MAG: CDF family Co(II)/Ni(II) efflux transporter DmeF [Gammaproteobacteria bacterium]|nr:CDF family Co(II)/Ni(II) efflux transporter DmeF [Gammaproteobacteria bacterium]